MDKNTKKDLGRYFVVFVITGLLILIPSLIFDFYYDLNDDTAIKDIISGTYTGIPSGYCIQMLYPLSFVLALGYRAIPVIPWYGLFLCVCQYCVFALITNRIIKLLKNKLYIVIALLIEVLIVFGLCFRQMLIIQYSVTSGICMIGAVFLFITEDMTDKVGIFLHKNFVPAMLVVLSFMIRTEVCIMLLPFLLLAGLYKWGSEEKIFTANNFRKYLILIGSVLIIMMGMLSLDKLAYRGSDWANFRNYFDDRTKVYDFYELPSFDENKEFYDSIGLSEESFMLLENYNFALDDSINEWIMKSIADYQVKKALSGESTLLKSTYGYVSKNSLGEAVWLYKRMFLDKLSNIVKYVIKEGQVSYFSRQIALEYAVLIAYIILFLLAIVSKRISLILYAVGLFGIRSIIWLYLLMADRVLERVSIPLLLTELAVIVGILLSCKKCANISKYLKITTAILCVAYLFFATGNNIISIHDEYDSRYQADIRWKTLTDYCDTKKGKFFVIDVYSATSYKGAFYSEKIFKNVDNSYRNYDICGGWVAKSPIAKEKLKKSGIKDIEDALIEQKCYFVADCDKDLSWLKKYYNKRSINVEINCIDTIKTVQGESTFKVYSVTKK